jgi:hypothetical protein
MKTLKNLIWILPSSLALGAVLSLLDGGTWWIGFLAYALLLTLGLMALAAIWQSAGSSRSLILMLLLAFFLRFGVGLFFSWALPIYGNDSEVHNAGFIFRDALTYDTQSWDLASSGDPLWKSFDRSYGIEEQYGGLTFLLSLVYRFLSPDMHRPWLTILLSALVGAAGVGFAWKGGRQAWGEPMGWLLGWIMALYPESLLAGASQIREPFLTLFIAVAFLCLADWQVNHRRTAWMWLVGSFLGAMLFSPGVAVFALVVLGVWFWLRAKDRRIRWGWVAGGAILGISGILFLGFLVSGTLQTPSGPLVNLVNWLRYSASYSASVTELSSGWIQTVFRSLPGWLHLPFITAYGVAQPLLPAAIADPAVWPSRLMGILRGLGWYALLPFLIYSLYPILKTVEKRERMAWLWLWVTAWIWILLCSFRAGGDQWDNPRYRLMMLMFQGGLAGYSLLWARQNRDHWLGRALAVEGVFLVLFGYWYFARYTEWRAGQVHVFVILALILFISVLILGGGWILDRRRNKS